MASPLTKQPMKALFTVYTLLKEIPHLLYLNVKFILPSLRQHRAYTHRQAVGVALLRTWFNYASAVEFLFPLSLEPGKEKERWVVLPPAPSSLYIGPLSSTEVEPATTGGTWYPHLYDPDTDSEQRVVLHLHGGAYVTIGARDGDLDTARQVLVDGMQSMVFFPQYRLSTYPNSQFPAALQDAATAYKYLLDQGISPSRIVLSGDSAGGNLAIALLRFLHEHEGHLPKPAAVLLWSPWVDFAFSPEDLTSHKNQATDYVPLGVMEWGARTYSGKTPRHHPYFSPMRHPFHCSSPIVVMLGKKEVLYDSISQFINAMQKVKGNKVESVDLGDTPHDIMLAGVAAGFLQEALLAGRKVLDYLVELGL